MSRGVRSGLTLVLHLVLGYGSLVLVEHHTGQLKTWYATLFVDVLPHAIIGLYLGAGIAFLTGFVMVNHRGLIRTLVRELRKDH